MGRVLTCIVVLFSAFVGHAVGAEKADRVRFGRPITIQPGEEVGDVVCIACPVINRGRITGDAVVIMGPLDNQNSISGDSVVVMGPLRNNGDVEGDAVAVAGPVTVGPNGSVGKDVTVVMGNANISPGASVKGTVERSMGGGGGALALLFFVPLTVGVVLSIVLALICYSVAGHARIVTIAESVRRKPGLSFLAGMIAIVVFVFALWAFSHMRPISGFLVVAACIALAVAMIVGYTGLSFAIGNRLRSASPVAAVVVGAVVIAVAQAIPLLQFLFGFVLLMFALGAAALTGFGTHPEWIESRIAGPGAAVR